MNYHSVSLKRSVDIIDDSILLLNLYKSRDIEFPSRLYSQLESAIYFLADIEAMANSTLTDEKRIISIESEIAVNIKDLKDDIIVIPVERLNEARKYLNLLKVQRLDRTEVDLFGQILEDISMTIWSVILSTSHEQ